MEKKADKIRKITYFYQPLKMLYADILVTAARNCITEVKIKNIGFKEKLKTTVRENQNFRDMDDGGGF
jgi:hypothetical protein